MKTSLTKFCKDYPLAKTTVFNRCKELGIDTSEGVCPTDCDRLLHEFNLISAEPDPDTALSVEVQTGNHQIVLSLPGNARPLL